MRTSSPRCNADGGKVRAVSRRAERARRDARRGEPASTRKFRGNREEARGVQAEGRRRRAGRQGGRGDQQPHSQVAKLADIADVDIDPETLASEVGAILRRSGI